MVGAAVAGYFILNSDNAAKAQPVPAGQLPATHLLHAALSFVWLGLVLGISFLESWVKFRADLITRVVGLDVGRNVFHALNRVEIVFALAAFLLTVKDIVAHSPSTLVTGVWLAPVVIVALQSLWLQPLLDARARMFIKGTPLPKSQSWLHLAYVLVELAKVLALALSPFLYAPFSGLLGF